MSDIRQGDDHVMGVGPSGGVYRGTQFVPYETKPRIPVIDDAYGLAEELHEGQVRKSTGRPYFEEHLLKVGKIVQAAGGSDVVIMAALLHDAIEDQPDRDPDGRIREVCGQEVLDLVRECTEIGPGGEDKAPWIDRKRAYLEHLKSVSVGALLISVADKLQSARDDLKPYVEAQGDSFYNIFKKAGDTQRERKQNTLWFHRQLDDAFKARLDALASEYGIDDLDGIARLIVKFQEVVSWLESH